MTTTETQRPSFSEVVKYFNPAWFAAVMGTAVVPLAIAFFTGSWVEVVAAIFTIIAVLMFVAILIPWTLRFFMFPSAVRGDLHHPIAASFFPTMPIAVIIIALDLLKYPDMFFSPDTSHTLAFWMWVVGSIGTYLAAFVVLPKIYRSDAIELTHANFGWFIPVAGFELALIYPNRFELTFGLSIVSFGIGFFLFLFVGSLVYQRYVLETLPASKFAATSFIAIAPTAIITVALFKMIHLFEAGHRSTLTPTPSRRSPYLLYLQRGVSQHGRSSWPSSSSCRTHAISNCRTHSRGGPIRSLLARSGSRPALRGR
jgi:tellurite resistance protein TehA-like permease